METIGKKIRTLRKNKNMTQEQLAEVLSVTSQSVSKWENSLAAPDISLLPIIARFFGITMDELFNYRLDALNYKERFIRFMADNGVLNFGEFPLQSGRVSPYYINTGNYHSGSQIAKLGEFYAECIRENSVRTDLLVGITSREMPLVVSTGMTLFHKYGLDLDYCEEKEVGNISAGAAEITLIEDTLTSGDTFRKALEHIRKYGDTRVTDIIVSVDRLERGARFGKTAAQELEMEYGVKIHAIVTSDDIICALENGVIAGAEYLDAIREYQRVYAGRLGE